MTKQPVVIGAALVAKQPADSGTDYGAHTRLLLEETSRPPIPSAPTTTTRAYRVSPNPLRRFPRAQIQPRSRAIRTASCRVAACSLPIAELR